MPPPLLRTPYTVYWVPRKFSEAYHQSLPTFGRQPVAVKALSKRLLGIRHTPTISHQARTSGHTCSSDSGHASHPSKCFGACFGPLCRLGSWLVEGDARLPWLVFVSIFAAFWRTQLTKIKKGVKCFDLPVSGVDLPKSRVLVEFENKESTLPGTPKSPILSGYFGPVAFYSVTLRFSCVKT